MKSVELASFTFDAKRTLEKLRGSARKKPHACKHGGGSGQEEVCTYLTVDGGQTDGHGNMANELFDCHGDTADGDQTNNCRYSMCG